MEAVREYGVMTEERAMPVVMVRPQYIKDTAGKSLVVLPQKEYERMLDNMEELEDLALYKEAKAEDSGERILFSDYLTSRGLRNG